MPKIRIFSSSKQKKLSNKGKDISLDSATETTDTTISSSTNDQSIKPSKEKKTKSKSKNKKIKIRSDNDPIVAQLDHLQQQSPWLSKLPLEAVPIIERHEAHINSSDKGLPIGVFYSAYTINRICLKERHESDPMISMDDSSDSEEEDDDDEDNDNHNSQQALARQQLADSTLEKEGQYCIKCMTKKLYKKLYSTHKSRFLQAVANLLVEANYLSKLNHPNILQARGQVSPQATADKNNYKHHDAFFLITDCIQETLEDRLERWRTEQAKDPAKYAVCPKCPLFVQSLGYCTEIASALTYLHERNIVVLGLTPSSIGFLANSGRLQLCDLSTCREVAAFETTNSHCAVTQEIMTSPEVAGGDEADALQFEDDEMHEGENDDSLFTMMMVPIVETGTIPRYMAPELVTQGATGVSLMADSYSLAIITLEALTLQKAFSHYKSGQFVVKVCMEGKRPNLSVYPQLQASPIEGILKRAWRHSADKRWSCAQIYEAFQVMMDKLGGIASNIAIDDSVATSPNTASLMVESSPTSPPSTPQGKRQPRRGLVGYSKATSMRNVTTGRSLESPTQPTTSKPRSPRQQRQPRRGLAGHSKATSMRNVTSSGETLFGRKQMPRNSSFDDTTGDPSFIQQFNRATTATTRHSDGGAQVKAEATAAMAATGDAEHLPESTTLQQMQGPTITQFQGGQPAVELNQSFSQQPGALQPAAEVGEARPQQRDSLIDDSSEDSATRAKEEAIVMGDGTTITIKKPKPTKRVSRVDSKRIKEKRENATEESEEDLVLAAMKPPEMRRTQSVPTEGLLLAPSAERATKKPTKRVYRVDSTKIKEKPQSTTEESEEDLALAAMKPPEMRRTQSVPTVGLLVAPSAESATKKSTRKNSADEAELGDIMKKKRTPQRSRSGMKVTRSRDNEVPATDVGKRRTPQRTGSGMKDRDNEAAGTGAAQKKLPRRKPSNGGTRKMKQPVKAASERNVLTKPKTRRTFSEDNEVEAPEPENKASHGRRSIEIPDEEPDLAMPTMQRHVSAYQ